MPARLAAVTAAALVAAVHGRVPVDGHAMYYRCEGSGHPTVVLEAGSPDTSAVWQWVEPALARVTRVCAYDRAGLGRSAPAPRTQHRTARTQVRELHSLLRKARIPGPYVLVGHSWGGMLAELFAHDYPDETVGLVLLDPTTFPYLTPDALRHLPRRLTREGIDVSATVAEVSAIRTLGRLPLVVIGNGRGRADARLRAAQDALARLSSDSVHAIALGSTHYVQKPPPAGQPEVVVAAARAVLGAARLHRRPPGCGRLFFGERVECLR